MKDKSLDKLIGSYCKIVSHEPGDARSHVIYGMLTDIDYDSGFLVVESQTGTGLINITTVEAIKPWKKI
jgi:hypothetical protein